MAWGQTWYFYYVFGWFAVWVSLFLGIALINSIDGFVPPSWKYKIDISVQRLSMPVNLTAQETIERLTLACIPVNAIWKQFTFLQRPVPFALKWVSDREFEMHRATNRHSVYVQGEVKSNLGQTIISVTQRTSSLGLMVPAAFMLNPLAVSNPAIFVCVFMMVLIATLYSYIRLVFEVRDIERFLTNLFRADMVIDHQPLDRLPDPSRAIGPE